MTWHASGNGGWTASVAGTDVSCQGDDCVVYVDTGGPARSGDARGSGRTWSRAASSADARRAGVAARTWSVTGRPADGRGAAAVSSSDARGAGQTGSQPSDGRSWTAVAGQKPMVISADGNGYAYATGDVAGRISSIDAMARYAPVEAAAQGIARLALEDPDSRVQRAAVDALAGLRGPVRDQQLRRIAREHRSPDIRHRAEAALR